MKKEDKYDKCRLGDENKKIEKERKKDNSFYSEFEYLTSNFYIFLVELKTILRSKIDCIS